MSSSDAELAGEATRIATRNMTHSPLLRLPGELRNKTLTCAVGGHTIVVHNTGKLASPFEPNPDTRLIFRLTTASKSKPPKDGDGIGDGGRDTVDDTQSEVDMQIADTERVSQIFTVTRVCHQLYTETALSHYKTNYFHFSTPCGLEAFTKQLTLDQRCAITAISIDDEYLMHKFADLGSEGLLSELGLPSMLPMSHMRQMLPGLRKIFVKPEGLRVFIGATAGDQLIRILETLEIGR